MAGIQGRVVTYEKIGAVFNEKQNTQTIETWIENMFMSEDYSYFGIGDYSQNFTLYEQNSTGEYNIAQSYQINENVM